MELLIFAKAPVPGQVKTRLMPTLDAGQAADLHARLVAETLDRLAVPAPCPVTLCCAPDADRPFFRNLAERYEIACRSQEGEDLGQRMYRAASRVLNAGRWPILVGTDCPVLDRSVVLQACAALEQGHEAVVGPAEDGGYVLLGLRRISPRLFTGIEWGGDRVLARTREAFGELGWRWRELDTLWDLDRPDDLERYLALEHGG